MQYFDKNGVEIKAGMTIRMEDGSLELVYDTTDSYGNPDLGINASNEDYLELHPFASREFYSLCNFDMRYTEVVDDQTVAENNFEQSTIADIKAYKKPCYTVLFLRSALPCDVVCHGNQTWLYPAKKIGG